jgi:hypothetical protein
VTNEDPIVSLMQMQSRSADLFTNNQVFLVEDMHSGDPPQTITPALDLCLSTRF